MYFLSTVELGYKEDERTAAYDRHNRVLTITKFKMTYNETWKNK